MKKLIAIFLVLGVFLTACGGGGQKAVPTEEGLTPTEAAAPTSAVTATPVPTATPTPTPIPEPEPSPEYGPPPIIDLTVVYPDGVSITVPIYCPVPAEYCDTGIDVYDYDGNYLGLGFSLPEGTPIFSVGDGVLRDMGKAAMGPYLDGSYVYYFSYDLIGTDDFDPDYKKPDWAVALPYVRFEYEHEGFGTAFPNPEIIDGELYFPPWPDTPFFRIRGGQELGTAIDPDFSTLWPYGAKGQDIYGINFVFAAKSWRSHELEDSTFRIRIN